MLTSNPNIAETVEEEPKPVKEPTLDPPTEEQVAEETVVEEVAPGKSIFL